MTTEDLMNQKRSQILQEIESGKSINGAIENTLKKTIEERDAFVNNIDSEVKKKPGWEENYNDEFWDFYIAIDSLEQERDKLAAIGEKEFEKEINIWKIESSLLKEIYDIPGNKIGSPATIETIEGLLIKNSLEENNVHARWFLIKEKEKNERELHEKKGAERIKADVYLKVAKLSEKESPEKLLVKRMREIDKSHNGYLIMALSEASIYPKGYLAKEFSSPGYIRQNIPDYKVMDNLFSMDGKTKADYQRIILKNPEKYEEYRKMAAMIEFSSVREKVIIKNTDMSNEKSMVETIQKQAQYLGFGDKLDQPIRFNIEAGSEEFILKHSEKFTTPGKEHPVDYEISFKKGKEGDRYFINGFRATLAEKPERTRYFSNNNKKDSQKFTITAKEAFNLLQGRSVCKSVQGKDDEPGTPKRDLWVKLDLSVKPKENEQYSYNTYGESYGFTIEKALEKHGVKIPDGEPGQMMINNLKKGNYWGVEANVNGEKIKCNVAVDAQFKNLQIVDEKGKTIKTGVQADKSASVEKSQGV